MFGLPLLALALLEDVGASRPMRPFKKTERAADAIDALVWRPVDVDRFSDQRLDIVQKPQRVGVLVVDVLVVDFVQLVAAKPADHRG